MTVPDALAELTAEPLVPLRAEWQSDRMKGLLATARSAEAADPDQYWEWAARQFRWSTPWGRAAHRRPD